MPILDDTKDQKGRITPVVKTSATNHSEEIHITLLKKSQDSQEKTIN